MFNKHFKSVILVLSLVLCIFFSLSFVYAAACYTYDSIANGCTATNGCFFRNDSWDSTGWCEELTCWSLQNQSDCTNINVPGQNCSWQGATTHYGCEEISCWSFSSTNSSTCESNSVNKSCSWSSSCYNLGGGDTDCYSFSTESVCLNCEARLDGCN